MWEISLGRSITALCGIPWRWLVKGVIGRDGEPKQYVIYADTPLEYTYHTRRKYGSSKNDGDYRTVSGYVAIVVSGVMLIDNLVNATQAYITWIPLFFTTIKERWNGEISKQMAKTMDAQKRVDSYTGWGENLNRLIIIPASFTWAIKNAVNTPALSEFPRQKNKLRRNPSWIAAPENLGKNFCVVWELR